MIDLRDIKDKALIESYVSGGVSIYAKFFGAKIIVTRDSSGIIFLKNKNQPITDIDFIINDIYERPVKFLQDISGLFRKSRVYYFTYDYQNDMLVCDNPDSSLNYDGIINNHIIFDGYLNKVVKKMFVQKHTNKILDNYLTEDSHIMSLIIKSKHDRKCMFKIDNKRIKLPSFKFPPACEKILIDVINSIEIDNITRVCINKHEESHVYMTIINKIFLKFINNFTDSLESIDLQPPEVFKPKNVSGKYQYLDKEIINVIKKNPNLFYVYSMFLNQFRKNKVFVGKNDKAISDKYVEIYKEIRGACVNNIFGTSLPPIDEILKI